MTEDLHKILLLLAQRKLESAGKNPTIDKWWYWGGMYGGLAICHLCELTIGDTVLNSINIDGHALTHLKEYGLISYA